MERLTYRDKKGKAHIFCKQMCADANEDCTTEHDVDICQRYVAFDKLATYEDADGQGMILPAPLDDVESFSLDGKNTWVKFPSKVDDAVYLIDRDEDNKLKVYEGKWERVSLVQASKDGSFELCGEISYDIRDCFYNDGRTMKHGMYVGQESTRIGEVVFLTKEEAIAKLKEMEGSHE